MGYVTINEKGLILETNITAANLLGKFRADMVKKPISNFILSTDQGIYYLCRKMLFETGEPQTCELRMVRPEGPPCWARLDTTVAPDEGGAPVCRISALRAAGLIDMVDVQLDGEKNLLCSWKLTEYGHNRMKYIPQA